MTLTAVSFTNLTGMTHEGNDEDEDNRDDSEPKGHHEPKDHRELSGNSAGIAKDGGGGTHGGNAATPIAPAANEGDSASGIDNNGGPWGGNNTSGTAGGPTTPLATATTTPTAGGIAAALTPTTPTRTTAFTPTITVGGTATTDGDLDMASRHDLQGASCTVGGVLRGRAHGNVYNMADDIETEDPFIKPIIGVFFGFGL